MTDSDLTQVPSARVPGERAGGKKGREREWTNGERTGQVSRWKRKIQGGTKDGRGIGGREKNDKRRREREER